jgi:hypothetical protein
MENNKTPIKIFFLLIFLIVLLSFVYLKLTTTPISLSPDDSTMSFDNARVLLSAFPQEGIDWYCGKSPSFSDMQGNSYGEPELLELKKILGNDLLLDEEYC